MAIFQWRKHQTIENIQKLAEAIGGITQRLHPDFLRASLYWGSNCLTPFTHAIKIQHIWKKKKIIMTPKRFRIQATWWQELRHKACSRSLYINKDLDPKSPMILRVSGNYDHYINKSFPSIGFIKKIGINEEDQRSYAQKMDRYIRELEKLEHSSWKFMAHDEATDLFAFQPDGETSIIDITPYGKGQPMGSLFDGTIGKNMDPCWEKQLLQFKNKIKPYETHLFIASQKRSAHEKLQAIQNTLQTPAIIEPLLESIKKRYHNPKDVDVFALRTQDVFLLYTKTHIHVQMPFNHS